MWFVICIFFCFNEPATTDIYTYLHTLSLHGAFRIWEDRPAGAAYITKAYAFDAFFGADLDQSVMPCANGTVGKRRDTVQWNHGGANFDGFNDGHGRSSK